MRVNVRYRSQSLSTLLFDIGSVTEPGGHLLSYARWSLTPRSPLCPPPQH